MDLLFPRRLQGIATQGSPTNVGMVTSFALQFGLTEQNMRVFEELPGHPTVGHFKVQPIHTDTASMNGLFGQQDCHS